MTTQAKAKIFLAEERGCTENERFRSYHTFNSGSYFNGHKCAFADLYVLNDVTLAGRQSVKVNIDESSCILLLPVVGAIVYSDSNGREGTVLAGSLQVLYLPEDATVDFSNPYEDDLVNFIRLSIKRADITEAMTRQFHFNLDNNKNKLLPVSKDAATAGQMYPMVSIGKFTGRHEAVYTPANPHNSLFVYVIDGAFEVQGRLLHPHDGLGLWDEPNEIELEALSNDAIVLLIEQSGQPSAISYQQASTGNTLSSDC